MDKNKNKNLIKKLFADPYSGNEKHEQDVRKKVFVSLVVLSFLALGFGGWHIGRQLQSPFESKPDTNSSSIADSTGSRQGATTPVVRIESLRDKDTDGDGLSDYDELYVFKTSPYIADSDSDQINDKAEVDQGTDPNCPEGTECGRSITNNSTDELFTDLLPEQALPDTENEIDLSNLSVDELRVILRDSGASEELLSQISDDELLDTYQELLRDQSTTDASGNPLNITDEEYAQVTYEALKSFTPDEIRIFLIESGVPQETLDLVDDATIQQIFLDSLEQNVQTGTSP
ncbi:hypothetical protein IID19_02450 [Patescibacteria group bacterium]|nr:hypothetical protein [Patescibacteria group bacterium]